MFNTKYDVTSKKRIAAQQEQSAMRSYNNIPTKSYVESIEPDMSYKGYEGIIRAITESYDNANIVNEYIRKWDKESKRMEILSMSESAIESFNEASASSAARIVQGTMQRFYAKIRGLMQNYMQNIKKWMDKRKIADFKRQIKNIDREACKKKTLDGYEAPKNPEKLLADLNFLAIQGATINYTDNDTSKEDVNVTTKRETLENKKKELETQKTNEKDPAKQKSIQTEIEGLTQQLQNMSDNAGATKQYNVDTSSADNTDLLDKMVQQLLGNDKATLSDLSEEYHKMCYNPEQTNINIDPDTMFKPLEHGTEILKNFSQQENQFKRIADDTIKKAKNTKFRDSSEMIKRLNNNCSAMCSLCYQMSGCMFKEVQFGLNQANSIFQLAMGSAVSINLKAGNANNNQQQNKEGAASTGLDGKLRDKMYVEINTLMKQGKSLQDIKYTDLSEELRKKVNEGEFETAINTLLSQMASENK